MIEIQHFEFSPFMENTYLLSDESGECVIIDPGCYEQAEKDVLKAYVESKELKPVALLNTHCHIDHVFGNKFVLDTWDIPFKMHELDIPLLKSLQRTAEVYGIPNVDESPDPTDFIDEGDQITFGNSTMDILFVPGHAPGHVAFVSKEQKFVIGGDVLFSGSIGRTDLPGGHYETLIESIKTKFLPLGDDYTVHSGHGPSTNIGFEKENNPFLR